jgi:hypothetical protein
MTRVAAIGLFALVFIGAAGCAAESRSGAPPATRSADRLDPVDAFPQARGANPYMRQ